MKLNYPDLKEHLGSGEPAPVYVVTGSQDLLREHASRDIQEAALDESDRAFNLDKYDGEAVSSDQVAESCNLFPMMAGRRLVVVKRAGKLLQESSSGPILDYVDSPSPQTTLVLELEKPPDARRKAWKRLEKAAVVVQCEPLKEREIESWLREQAKNRKLTLGREEIRYLVEEFGTDLRRHLNELEKITLFAPEKKLDVETLAGLLGKGKAQSIFKFTEAVADRKAAVALKQLGRLLEEGESPLPILALLDRTVGQLLVAKELRGMRRRPGDAAGILGVPPWVVERLLRQSDDFDESELEKALDAVARIDRALKTSGVPSRLLLESLVISLCGGGAGRRRAPRRTAVSSKR
jgi:DNA polymerase-3 subunit delta